MTFRNRCLIAGANGIIPLSIPLELGRNQRRPVTEVTISNAESWQLNHWKSIRSSYNRSPFFEFYSDELEAIYRRSFVKLVDWNLSCLNWLRKKLEWESEFQIADSVVERGMGIDDFGDQVLPKNYLNWNPVTYRQVFQERTGFLPNLSILDLLFNAGPRTPELLQRAIRSEGLQF